MPGLTLMKNLIIVTGGAGFIGSNLINLLINRTNKYIISIDNYSSGSIKNHINNKRIKYLKSNTININKTLSKYKKKSIPFSILENLQEFTRVLKILTNVINQTQLVLNQYLNFV